MARHALIIACTKAATTGTKAIPLSKAEEVTGRWANALSDLDDLSFAWPGSKKPRVLVDPTRGTFTDVLDETVFSDGDEILLFYFGHSYPVGPSKVAPTFSKSTIESLKQNDFGWVFEQIFHNPISKLYAVLDTCHSGMLAPDLETFRSKIYCMMAAHNGYTKGAFSESLLHAIESRSDDVRQLLYDNQAGGVTFEKLFDYGDIQLKPDLEYSEPVAIGDLGGELVRNEKAGVPEAFRTHSPEKSVYRRVFLVLEILAAKDVTSLNEVMKEVRESESFLVSSDGPGEKKYISPRRILEYLDFISSIGFLSGGSADLKLTDEGRKASSSANFNILLVTAIMDNLFPETVDLEKLRIFVWEMLKEGVPPTALNVGARLRKKNLGRIRSIPNFKFAFTVLPYSGVFHRAPDAIYPI